jgi:DNA-binding NarL/FixJ family response regulator
MDQLLPVLVYSEDPVLEVGVAEQLRAEPEIVVVRRHDCRAATVALLVADEVDERTQLTARRLVDGGYRVVMVVTKLDEPALMAALAAGICGVVRRSDGRPEVLAQAAAAAAVGDGTLPPDLLGRLMEALSVAQRHVLQPRGLTLARLSGREVDVLRLIADGFDTAEVARKLSYSERTVKGVLQDVTRRYNLRNRTHAVAYALRLGLI